MNRRTFLGSVGLGAVVALLPNILKSDKSPDDTLEYELAEEGVSYDEVTYKWDKETASWIEDTSQSQKLNTWYCIMKYEV